jgi:hypothetical protein
MKKLARKHWGYREIIGASAVSTNLTPEETRELVRRLETMLRNGPLGPTAIVTTNDFLFGMARMLAILCELWSGPQIAVFRAYCEALGLARSYIVAMTPGCESSSLPADEVVSISGVSRWPD